MRAISCVFESAGSNGGSVSLMNVLYVQSLDLKQKRQPKREMADATELHPVPDELGSSQTSF